MRNVHTLSVKQVMARTGFSRRMVGALIENGVLTHVRREGRNTHIKIFESSVEALPDRATAASSSPARGCDADRELPLCTDTALL